MYLAAVLASVPLEQFLVLTWTIFDTQFYDDILLEGRKEQRDHKPGRQVKTNIKERSALPGLQYLLVHPSVPDAFHLKTIYSHSLLMRVTIRDIWNQPTHL